MVQKCNIKIDDDYYTFNVEGDFFWGKDELLYKKENSIISKTDWESLGFTCINIFKKGEFEKLKQSIRTNIIKALKVNNILVDEDNFKLSNYHNFIITDAQHLKVIDITRNLTNEDFNFAIDTLTERFSNFLGYKLTSWIDELKKTHIQIRINRPNSLDINPPHRDSYLSYYKDILNVWIPIEGCNSKTSLPVFPGSHLIKESEIYRTESKGAKINGNTYYVPCVLKTKDGILNMVRPNPKQGEALIFTPFLIHGAAFNNSDITRVSLELRFPKIND